MQKRKLLYSYATNLSRQKSFFVNDLIFDCLDIFSGHGVDVVKGELMFLLAKSNKDWWNVRTAAGTDGFVPANYVKVPKYRIHFFNKDYDNQI